MDSMLKMSASIDNAQVTNLIAGFRPQADFYRDMKRALANHRKIRAEGGWPQVVAGETLKSGMVTPIVRTIGQRLYVSGDMQISIKSDLYDDTVKAGVMRFQQRHGLEVNGQVDKVTLETMNIPIEARIDQLRVNLDRARWVLHDLPQDFVVVEIAGFNVRYIRSGQEIWKTRAIVGKTYLWAETRYWLYDGNIFAARFELLEFAINTAVWSTLALVYYRRYQVSNTFRAWYLFASRVLLGLSIASYALVLVPLNPLWSNETVSSTPIFNVLLLAYGYPLLISALLYHFYEATFKRWCGLMACLTGLVFVNLEIRHLWQGVLDINRSTGNGELYTYTIVWMLLAMTALLAGSIRFGKTVYKGGMALLLVVVAKIFLVDMADLEGLLRVASFMGLGLSLLALAYLYQRFNLVPRQPESE